MFHFPATTALLLRCHTFMSDVAIVNTLRNRAKDREPFTIKSDHPGNHHYFVRPVDGGFVIFATQLPTGYMK